MTKHFPAYLYFAALALLAACSKPSPFGSELLDEASYAYSDTFSLRCTVLREDSTLTSDRSSTADYFLCGQLNDPTFGPSTSEIFSLLTMQNVNPDFNPATDHVDSIRMILRYDAAGVYGDTLQPVSLRVYRNQADNQVRWDRDYYSNQSLSASEEIGALDFTPVPRTQVKNPFDTAAAATKYNYLNVPLNNAFGAALLGIDSLQTVNDSLFWLQLRGLRIAVNSAGVPGTMLAFDLNDGLSRVRLSYHRDGDTTNRTFDYYFAGANKFTHFTHDYTGTPAGQSIDQNSSDRLYLQGMSGLKVKLQIPNAGDLDSIIINKAELVLTVADVPGDPASLTPSSQLVSTELQGDTAFVLISDVLYSLGPTFGSGFGLFGGAPETEIVNGVAVKRYRLTITDRFQAMIADKTGDIRNKTLYINVYPQRNSPTRTVLYGPQSATFPVKLELKYTRIE